MIVLIVFIFIMKQTEFHLVHNKKVNCDYNHITYNLDRIRYLFLSQQRITFSLIQMQGFCINKNKKNIKIIKANKNNSLTANNISIRGATSFLGLIFRVYQLYMYMYACIFIHIIYMCVYLYVYIYV